MGSSPTIATIRGIRKIKNVERRAIEPVRWPPRDWGVGGSRQMRISCNPLIFRMRGGKYIHSPLEKGFSNRECGRKSRRIHQYSCGRIRLKTFILQYYCADYWRAIFGLWGCLGWPPVWQTGQQIGSNPIRSTRSIIDLLFQTI